MENYKGGGEVTERLDRKGHRIGQRAFNGPGNLGRIAPSDHAPPKGVTLKERQRQRLVTDFEKSIAKIRYGWSSGDREFSKSVAVFVAEQLVSIRAALEEIAATSPPIPKPKRKPTEWQSYFAAGMKAGKTPVEIGREWKKARRTA